MTLISAVVEDYPEQNVGEQFTFCQTCSDATYVTLSSIQTPNSTIFVAANMTNVGNGDFCYNYTAVLPGRHDFRGISDGCFKTFATYIDVDTPNIVADIVLLLFFLILGAGLYITTSKINYEQWHNSILGKYTGKNEAKVITSGIVYSFIKEAFFLYYMIGFPIIMIIRDIVTSFGMTYLSGVMNGIVIIYSLGIIICGILFLGKMQEVIVNIGKQMEGMRWGI